jgi:hypothetical protein
VSLEKINPLTEEEDGGRSGAEAVATTSGMRQTDRLGVNAVERIFLHELGWIFKEQIIADRGIGVQVEVTNVARTDGPVAGAAQSA